MGIIALLAAFPPCLSQTVNELADMQTQPLLSGSVCRVRDTVDFLSVSANEVIPTQLRYIQLFYLLYSHMLHLPHK